MLLQRPFVLDKEKKKIKNNQKLKQSDRQIVLN